MFIFTHFFGMKPRTQRIFFRFLAVLLSVVFILPELAWTFDWRNLKRAGENAYLDFEIKKDLAKILGRFTPADSSAPCIVHIEDLHTNYEAQDHIQQLITQFVEQNKIRLVAMEGSAGFLDAGRLRQLPYPDIKKRLFRHFMQNGQLSGTEAAALSASSEMVLFGAEDAETYEQSLNTVRGFLGRSVQVQFQNVLYLLEEMVSSVNTEALAALDEKAEAFQGQKISLSAYLGFLRETAAAKGVNLSDYPEVAALETSAEAEAHDVDLKTQRLREAIRARLYTRPALQAAVDRWREDLDRMDRILNIAAFPEDLAYARGQGMRFSIKAFLEFYRDQAPALGLPAEIEPKLLSLDARLREALQFYSLAEQRNRALVENTLRAMKTYHATRAVLVAGGFHTRGIDAELDAHHVARLTLRPAIRSWQDSPQYYRQLTGEPGPFRALFTPVEKHLLALPSVFEMRPEHQDFWQAFGALYFSQIAGDAGRGKSPEVFRREMDGLTAAFNQKAPYAVRVDWGAFDASTAAEAMPLLLEARGKTLHVTATPHAWPAAGVRAFYTYGQGADRLALYPAELTPEIIAHLRSGGVRSWKNPRAFLASLAAVLALGAGSIKIFTAITLPLVLGLAAGGVVTVVLIASFGVAASATLGTVAAMVIGLLVYGWGDRNQLLRQASQTDPAALIETTIARAGEETWAVTVKAHASQGQLTTGDILNVTLAVAENPQFGGRWQPWLEQVAGGKWSSNPVVQRLAKKILAQYSARTVASANAGAGVPVLQVPLGTNSSQRGEAILKLFGLAAEAAAQDALPDGDGPLSRLAAVESAMGSAIEQLVAQNLTTAEPDPVLEAAWDTLVNQLDASLRVGLAYDALHGYAEQVNKLHFIGLRNEGFFTLGMPGWVKARLRETAEKAAQVKAGETADPGYFWKFSEREHWLNEFGRLAQAGVPEQDLAWQALWGQLRSADVPTRLELAYASLRSNRAQGTLHFKQFNLPLIDLKARAEELDHDGRSVINASVGANGFIVNSLSDLGKDDLGRLCEQAKLHNDELSYTLRESISVEEAFQSAEALAAGITPGQSAEEFYEARKDTEKTLGNILLENQVSQAEIQKLLQNFYENSSLRHNLEQTMLFFEFMNLQKNTVALAPLLRKITARIQAEPEVSPSVLEISRMASAYAQLTADLFGFSTFCENIATHQNMDLRTMYALCKQLPQLLNRDEGFGSLALELQVEPGFLESSRRVRGDYGLSLLSMIANSVVNARKELNIKIDALGTAAVGFQGKIKVTFGPNTIRVEDNGRGFPEAKLKAFGKRGDTSRPEKGGRGIGNYMAAKIIREIGGHMEVANKTGAETGAVCTYTFEPAGGQATDPGFEAVIRDWVTDPILQTQLATGKGGALASGGLGRMLWLAGTLALAWMFSPDLVAGSAWGVFSVLGAISGLGTVLIFGPRWFYAWYLSRPRAPALTEVNIKHRLALLLEELEQNGELPAAYQRPHLQVLPDQSWISRLIYGKRLGFGVQGVQRTVYLHPNFLSLPQVAQRAVLRHEIFEAYGLGHGRASWEEFKTLFQMSKVTRGAELALAHRLRALSVEQWLGQTMVKALVELHPGAGDQAQAWPLLELSDRRDFSASIAELLRSGMNADRLVAVRVLEMSPNGRVRFNLLADTLGHLASLQPMEFGFKYAGVLQTQAAVGLTFNVPERSVEFNTLAVSPSLRSRGTGLGNALLGNVGQVLQTVLPGAPIEAVAIHPVSAWAFTQAFNAEVAWRHPASQQAHLWEKAFIVLGILPNRPGHQTANRSMADLIQALQRAKANSGSASQSDAEFLLAQAKALAARLRAEPAGMAAWVHSMQGLLAGATPVEEWVGLLGNERALTQRIFQTTLDKLYLTGHVRDSWSAAPVLKSAPNLDDLSAPADEKLWGSAGQEPAPGTGNNLFRRAGQWLREELARQLFKLLQSRGLFPALLRSGTQFFLPAGRSFETQTVMVPALEAQIEAAEAQVEKSEVEAGARGEVAVVPTTQGRAVAIEAIPFLLYSRSVPDTVRGLLSLELRAGEMNAEQLDDALKMLKVFNQDANSRIARMAWLTLKVIRQYLSTEGRGQADAILEANRKNGRLFLTTSSQRLAAVYDFMKTQPGIMRLLQRPGGVVVNDIGIGGPVPVTTAELTEFVKGINPENQVVGADIFLPAFRSWDHKHKLFAYHNAQGEVIGIYGLDGRPVPDRDAAQSLARFQAQMQNFQQRTPLDPDMEITADPVQAYARDNGFKVQLASYGQGIRAAIKFCFNVLYLNPGKETAIINRMGADMAAGDYLLNGLAAPQDRQFSATLVMYQKQGDGSMLPLSVHLILEKREYAFPLKPGHQTIEDAESLATEEHHFDDHGQLMFEDRILERYGLTREDVKVSTMVRSRLSKVVVPATQVQVSEGAQVSNPELESGLRGLVANIPAGQTTAVSLEQIPALLHSGKLEEMLQGAQVVENRAAELNQQQVDQAARDLMGIVTEYEQKGLVRAALRALYAIQGRLEPEVKTRVQAFLEVFREDTQVILKTYEQRYQLLMTFIRRNPGIQQLLRRPGGVVVNEIGLGGPLPLATGDLTRFVKTLNPANQVIGADILVPEFRVTDSARKKFAYLNAQGEIIGIYAFSGEPLAPSEARPLHARFQTALRQFQTQGQANPLMEVTRDPLQAYAQAHGFEVRTAFYGEKIKAHIKVCFNVMYMNAGQEVEIINRIGEDVEPGGYLINGYANVVNGINYTNFVLYRKQPDGRMLPLSMNFLMPNIAYEFRFEGDNQTIKNAESLHAERYQQSDGILHVEKINLAKYGIHPGDVRVIRSVVRPDGTPTGQTIESTLDMPSRGNLRVSPWRILGTLATAVLSGLFWTVAFPHGTLLIPLLWWGGMGLAMAVNYLPRLVYLGQLLRPTAPVLKAETVNEQIAPLLEELEQAKGLPANYQRPRLEVLPVQSFVSKLFFGIRVAQGQVNTIYLHPNFLSLSPGVQRAVLLHEIVEAHSANHFKATVAEYRFLAGWLLRSFFVRPAASQASQLAPAQSRIVFFSPGRVEGSPAQISNLGAKGRNLTVMASLGLPVPPGFTLEDDVSLEVNRAHRVSEEVRRDVMANLAKLEQFTNQRLGDPENPLLVSTRSGAEYSLPGMMITITHVGLNDQTVPALALKTGKPYLVWSWYAHLIAAYGEHALGLPKSDFERMEKQYQQLAHKPRLDVSELQGLVKLYKDYLMEKRGEAFPQDVKEQLLRCIQAVMASWEDPMVKEYRLMHGIPDVGTGVTVMKMVFGDWDSESGSGVAYSRDPETGENRSSDGNRAVFGEYIARESGEAIVSGSRTPVGLSDMAANFPRVYAQLVALAESLETHFHAVQDIEFTFEAGKLYLLQTRNASKMIYPRALIRTLRDMVSEGVLSEEEVLEKVSLDDLGWAQRSLEAPKIASNAPAPMAIGVPAAPGIGTGVVVFTEVQAKVFLDQGKNIILVKNRAEKEDEVVINHPKCMGVIDLVGGRLSHAASLLRTLRSKDPKPCVVGLEHSVIFESGSPQEAQPHIVLNGKRIVLGEAITLDGNYGGVYEGDNIPATVSDIAKIESGAESLKATSQDWKLYQQIQSWIAQYQAKVERENQALQDAVAEWLKAPAQRETPVNKVLNSIQSQAPELMSERNLPIIILLASLLIYPKRDLENQDFMSYFNQAYASLQTSAGEESARLAGGQVLAVLLESSPATLQRLLHLGGIHGTLINMLAGLESRPDTFRKILESMQVDVTRFNPDQFAAVYLPKTNFVFSRALRKWSPENLRALLVQLRPETLFYIVSEWILGTTRIGMVQAYYSSFTQLQFLAVVRGILETWEKYNPADYAAYWEKVKAVNTSQQTPLFQKWSAEAVQKKKGPLPIFPQNWVKGMLENAGIHAKGELRLSLGRILGNALGVLGLSVLLGTWLAPVAAVVFAAFGALALLANYLPRIYYVSRLARGNGEVLTDANIETKLADLLSDLEFRGVLPADYRRPHLRVLPPQSWASRLFSGWLIGQGKNGVVSLHPNFLALPAAAQLAVLRHEIYEAQGRGHFLATWAEAKTLWSVGREGAQAGTQRLAYRLRAVPVSAWLGADFAEALRRRSLEMFPGTEALPLIDGENRKAILDAADQWMDWGMDPKHLVVARMLRTSADGNRVQLNLVIDSLENLRYRFSWLSEEIKGEALELAAAALKLNLSTRAGSAGSVEIAGVGMRSDFRDQHYGASFLGGVQKALQDLLPGATLKAEAVHPASAILIARYFNADLAWGEMPSEWVNEFRRAFRALGIELDLPAPYPEMEAMQEAFHKYLATQGAAQHSDIGFILNRLQQLVQKLQANPGALDAWLQANSRNLRKADELGPLGIRGNWNEKVLSELLFDQTFLHLKLRGRVPAAAGASRQAPATAKGRVAPYAFQTPQGLPARDLALIQQAAENALLQDAVLAALPQRREGVAQVGPGVRLQWLGGGAFKRAYRADVQVRFASGEEIWVPVTLKVPRNFISTLISQERNRWLRLRGYPETMAFVLERGNVLAEEFVDAVPQALAPRRAAAVYLSLLEHLQARSGSHWFFYDPKAENLLVPKSDPEQPKVVDLDGVAPTPVSFSPFTVLVYLGAFYSPRPLLLTHRFNGLGAPLILLFSALSAYFIQADRAVFDAVLDAYGAEKGRQYLQAALQGFSPALAGRSSFVRALKAYLRDGIRTYAAPQAGIESQTLSTLPGITADPARLAEAFRALPVLAWVGEKAARTLMEKNQDTRPATQWPVLDVRPADTFLSIFERARALGIDFRQLVVLRVMEESPQRGEIKTGIMIDTLEGLAARNSVGLGQEQESVARKYPANVSSAMFKMSGAQVNVMLTLTPKAQPEGGVLLNMFALDPALQKQGLGQGMMDSLRSLLTQLTPGADFRALALHPAAASMIIKAFGADIAWDDPEAQDTHLLLGPDLIGLDLAKPDAFEPTTRGIRQALVQAKEKAREEGQKDAEFVLDQLRLLASKLAKDPSRYPNWAWKHELAAYPLPEELKKPGASEAAWTTFLYRILVREMYLAGKVPRPPQGTASAPSQSGPSPQGSAPDSSLAWRNDRLELNTTDPQRLQAWERLQNSAAGPVWQALAQHVQKGGSVRFSETPGDLLLQKQGRVWTLTPRLLLGPALSGVPAPWPVWELVLGQAQGWSWNRAWDFVPLFAETANRHGLPALAQALVWLQQQPDALSAGADTWRARLGLTGIGDLLLGRTGSVHAEETAAWLRINLLRPLFRSWEAKGTETTVPREVVQAVRAQVALQIRAHWVARQAVSVFLGLPAGERGKFTFSSDDPELLAAVAAELAKAANRHESGARLLQAHWQTVLLAEGRPADQARGAGLMVLARAGAHTAPAQLGAWASLLTSGRVYVLGLAANETTLVFAADEAMDFSAIQKTLTGQGSLVVGQQSAVLLSGLADTLGEEDRLAQVAEDTAAASPALLQALQASSLGTRSREELEVLLRDVANRMFDEIAGDPMHKALALGKGVPAFVTRAQAVTAAPWKADVHQRSAVRLDELAKAGQKVSLELATRLAPRLNLGLRNRLFLALVAGIFLTRKVSLLETAFAASSEVRGSGWLAIFRHSQFAAVLRTLWGVVTGQLVVRGEVDPETAAAIKTSLRRNPLFNLFFGKSTWADSLQAETAALRQETERLGDIGLELAPSAYLQGVLTQQLRENNVSSRDRETLLRNLWENPAWISNLSRLQALSREPETRRREQSLRRLERRMLTALLSELEEPGASLAYQLAVVRALAVFAPGEQVRLRLAVPAGTEIAYPLFWVPELVLRTPQLRNPLVSLFPAYDDAGTELKPADPSIIRTTEGSA